MLRFFRKIRQKTLAENAFLKYLIYAIGEIILVVIGILIALSINNWNESQKLSQKEINVAKELNIELNENLVLIKKQLGLWENRDKRLSEMILYLDSKDESFTNSRFDSILLDIIAFDDFRLKQSKFQRIISLEDFEFKRSPGLITKMLDLNSFYTTLNSYYQTNKHIYNNQLQPYLIDNYSIENFENIYLSKNTASKIDYRILSDDLKFINIIYITRGSSAPFVQRIKVTIEKIEELTQELTAIYPEIRSL